jgi:hypothetical protein
MDEMLGDEAVDEESCGQSLKQRGCYQIYEAEGSEMVIKHMVKNLALIGLSTERCPPQ